MEKLKKGYKPQERVEAANLWRIFAGDRLVLVGESRPDMKAVKGILSLLLFNENAIVVGEPQNSKPDTLAFFGGIVQNESACAAKHCQAAIEAVQKIGTPRTIANPLGNWNIELNDLL